MINPYTPPSVVGRDVVHTRGKALAKVLVDKSLAADLHRLSLGMPFLPAFLKSPINSFFFASTDTTLPLSSLKPLFVHMP